MTLDIFLRIFVALILGGLIGLEREYRSKEAGFRTHFLVALGSALFTILSQYGFKYGLGDSSRVAAQIVSGIGFLGAGTIIFQRNFIRGLTTAAGLWVTAAVGMACGCSMYILAGVSTLLVLIGLELLSRIVPPLSTNRLHISYESDKEKAARDASLQIKRICKEVYTYNISREAAGSGEKVKREFSQKYTVVAPSATVSADIMNVLYAGYDNPMSVSVPGVPNNRLHVTMTGGTLTQKGDGHYIARPTTPGGEAVFTISAQNEGRTQEMGKFTFRIRKLPDPTAFIAYSDGQGGTNHFKGGSISKQILMGTEGIGAAIDDGLLNITFRVQGFQTVFYDAMGNAVPFKSNGANFTDQQKNQIRGLARGKRFYITEVHAIGPDGIERQLDGAMEVKIK